MFDTLVQAVSSLCCARHAIISTLQQPLDLDQFGRILKLPEILGLLCQIFPLYGRVSLISDYFGCCVVERSD